MKAIYHKYILNFKQPSGTSRGVLTQKETWFIRLEDNDKYGIGECGILRSLSVDDRPDYEEKLKWACKNIHLGEKTLWDELIEFPSIQFGIEQAFLSLSSSTPYLLYPSQFTESKSSIHINGLIWMGEEAFMKKQIEEKLKHDFNCIKMKIGAIDFETELKLLKSIRKDFSINDIEIRVDANGAFKPQNALEKLKRLSEYSIHSIEQPIKSKQYDDMAYLCEFSPIDIALDEELIGVFNVTEKQKLLQTIKPQYIILKPSLIGGYKGATEWIDVANEYNIKWWVTSALESNVGLNAIAQWTYTLENKMPQGLGTGSLFTNNFKCPLFVENGKLKYSNTMYWDIEKALSTL